MLRYRRLPATGTGAAVFAFPLSKALRIFGENPRTEGDKLFRRRMVAMYRYYGRRQVVKERQGTR